MSENVIPFRAPEIGPQRREIFYCTCCGSRAFKIVRWLPDEDLTVECANCETTQTFVALTVGEQ